MKVKWRRTIPLVCAVVVLAILGAALAFSGADLRIPFPMYRAQLR
jgi:hypothetical protein